MDKATAPARKLNEQVNKILGKGGEVVKKYLETTTNSSNKVVQAYQSIEHAVDKYTGGLKSRLTGAAKSIEDHKMAIAGIGAALVVAKNSQVRRAGFSCWIFGNLIWVLEGAFTEKICPVFIVWFRPDNGDIRVL